MNYLQVSSIYLVEITRTQHVMVFSLTKQEFGGLCLIHPLITAFDKPVPIYIADEFARQSHPSSTPCLSIDLRTSSLLLDLILVLRFPSCSGLKPVSRWIDPVSGTGQFHGPPEFSSGDPRPCTGLYGSACHGRLWIADRPDKYLFSKRCPHRSQQGRP